jgi:hypothetical protein
MQTTNMIETAKISSPLFGMCVCGCVSMAVWLKTLSGPLGRVMGAQPGPACW